MFATTYERWLRHPGGTGYASLTATLRNLAHELGLTPGARLRMPAPEADHDDEESAVFGRRRPVI